jgi:lipase chaperone LimK
MKNNKKIYRLIPFFFFAVLASAYYFANVSSVKAPEMKEEFRAVLSSNEIIFDNAHKSPETIKAFNKALPTSLEGIDLNIALPLDENGNLIIGLVLKDLFEIYLSAMGEEELEDILLRIQSVLAKQLESPALEQGYEALKRFIDYKVELANLEQQEHDPSLSELENIRQQKEVLAQIQQQYFSPDEADAFFAAEAEYDAFMLEHLTIQQNENLSVAEKQQQILALADALPEEVKQVREATMVSAKVYEQAQAMKAEGSSAEEIYQMRAQALGDEAASALAELDRERDSWNQRLASFSEQYQIIADSGMSEADANAEIEALLSRDFSSNEIIRVKAIKGL